MIDALLWVVHNVLPWMIVSAPFWCLFTPPPTEGDRW
jgi:hypothetical protein